jgi:Domain of unknown function (DUF4893)
MKTALFTLLAMVAFTAPARADGEIVRIITVGDQMKLDKFDSTLNEAVAEAKAGGSPADVQVLEEALAGKPLAIDAGPDPAGDWRCRTIKLGGTLPLTVYGWFKCRISDDGTGWVLEKTSGSQRTKGKFYTASDTRLTYLGAGHVAGEEPRRYGQTPWHNQVAYAERRGDTRILLMFPEPNFESKLDLLELQR